MSLHFGGFNLFLYPFQLGVNVCKQMLSTQGCACFLWHPNMSCPKRLFFCKVKCLAVQNCHSSPSADPLAHVLCYLSLMTGCQGGLFLCFNPFPLKLLNHLVRKKKTTQYLARKASAGMVSLAGWQEIVKRVSFWQTWAILIKRRIATCMWANSSCTIVHSQIKARQRPLFIQ